MDNKASTDVIQLQVQNSLRLQGKKKKWLKNISANENKTNNNCYGVREPEASEEERERAGSGRVGLTGQTIAFQCLIQATFIPVPPRLALCYTMLVDVSQNPFF